MPEFYHSKQLLLSLICSFICNYAVDDVYLYVYIPVSASCCRLVCYYDSSAESREGDGRFTVEDIDPNKCTHLVFASSDIEECELVPFCQTDKQRYWALNELKTRSVQCC